MLVSNLPVREFFRLSFGTVSDGGYAGLVFLVARAADAPRLQLRLFREWSDIHDLTGRYLAVIAPDADNGVLIEEELYHTQYGTAVPHITCIGDRDRLSWSAGRSWRSAVRMTPERISTRVAPRRPDNVRDHQEALTMVAGQMSEFFGISESLLPCAVVVALQEQAVFSVGLDDDSSMYRLLKHIKTRIEPTAALIRQQDAELVEAKAARARYRAEHGIEKLRGAARALHTMWVEQKTRLARDLDALADTWTGENATLCRWMSTRLGQDEPLSDDERGSARELLALLRPHGRLPKRLRRTLAGVNNGYPAGHDVLLRLAAAEAGEDAAQERIGRIKAELDRLGRELRLGDAVTGAATDLGLAPAGSAGLLPWRELSWPITVLARPDRTVPSVRFERG